MKFQFSSHWIFTGAGEPFPGASAKYPEVCGEMIVAEETPPYDIDRKVADDSGLWGKTRRHEVDGRDVTVTLFEPTDKAPSDPFARAVSALRRIFDYEDPMLSDMIMFSFNLIIQHKSFEARLEAVEKIVKKHTPPGGVQERRQSWIEMKKAIGID